MSPQIFESAFLAQVSYRLALSDSVDEMVAIASTIRNWVVPKPGKIAQYKSFSAACKDFLRTYPARDFPDLTENALLAPTGLLSKIEAVYDCSLPDITATQTTPGALYFARSASLDPSDWRTQIVATHRLLGTFGAVQFYY